MITMTLTVNFSGIAFGTFDFEVEIVTRNLKKWIIYNCESKLIYKGFLLLHQVTGNYPIFLFSFL